MKRRGSSESAGETLSDDIDLFPWVKEAKKRQKRKAGGHKTERPGPGSCQSSSESESRKKSSPDSLVLPAYDLTKIQKLGKPPRVPNWRSALDVYILEPLQARPAYAKQRVFYEDEVCVAIYDSFPKSAIHLLVLPRLSLSLPNVHNFSAQLHLSNLKVLHDRAKRIKRHLEARNQQCVSGGGQAMFRGELMVGYHGIPSMNYLHIHIISTDFVGIKNKKHYLSFAKCPEFFIPMDTMEKDLSENKTFTKKPDCNVLKEDLVCLHCNITHKNIPALKAHLVKCRVAKETNNTSS
jgi:aprataxin